MKIKFDFNNNWRKKNSLRYWWTVTILEFMFERYLKGHITAYSITILNFNFGVSITKKLIK